MKTNTEELLQQSFQIKTAASRMQEIRDTVIRVDRLLSRQSIGERFHPGIQSAAAQVERLGQDLDRMHVLLEQIAENYEACERRILDETEQVDALISRIRPRVIPIPPIISTWPPILHPRPDHRPGPRHPEHHPDHQPGPRHPDHRPGPRYPDHRPGPRYPDHQPGPRRPTPIPWGWFGPRPWRRPHPRIPDWAPVPMPNRLPDSWRRPGKLDIRWTDLLTGLSQ